MSPCLLPLVLVLAFALRLLLWSGPLHLPANDETEYIAVARDLLAGRGWQFYDHYHWLRAPLYPLWLAGSLWLAGGDPGTAEALHRAALPNIALSTATVYLSYRLAMALVGRRAARVAALISALLWTFVTFASLYMAETLFTFLFTAGLLCLARRPAGWRAVLAGVLFGLATLTRSASMLFLPAVALWLLVQPATDDRRPTNGREASRPDRRPTTYELRIRNLRTFKRAHGRDASRPDLPTRNLRASVSLWFNHGWPIAACFVLAAALTIAPWTLRNYAAYGRLIPVETGLSYNLWAFNEPRESGNTIFRTLENIRNPAERSDYATARGLARLREDPAILLRKLWPNWIALWRVKPIEDRFLLENYYSDVPLPLFASALALDDALYLVVALAAIAGLALYRSPAETAAPDRRARAWLASPRALLIGWLLYIVGTMLLTHGEARYRHFLFPALIPYAAWALAGRWRQWDREPRRQGGKKLSGLVKTVLRHPWGALAAALVGTTILVYYPWNWAASNLARGWYAQRAEWAFAAGDTAGALQLDQRALDVSKTLDGWLRLGDHARAKGDIARAAAAYRSALGRQADYVPSAAKLGDMLRAEGQDAAARAAFAADDADQQQLTDWSWRELRPLPLDTLAVGGGLDFGYVGGMYPAEMLQGAPARWTNGRGLLRFGQPAPTGGLLRLRLAAPRPAGGAVTAQVCAANTCQALQLAAGWRVYLVPLGPGATTIELRSDSFAAPDGRRLGLMISAASITPQ